jgi:hypothetical protein
VLLVCQHCILLTFYTELRNRIYKAITDDEGSKEIRLYRRSRTCGQFLKVRNPGRQYLGFAQTNRMFRSEFMPLYMTVRRPLIIIQDVPYYLEVFPLHDPVLTASIITLLGDLVPLRPRDSDSGIDLLPLLRADLSMFSFSIFASKISWRPIIASREFPFLLLENSYHDLALYGGSWEETITAIYFFRQCPMFQQHHCPSDDKPSIELRLSAKVDAEASDFEKLRIFQNFVHHTQVRGKRRVKISCISGRLSMLAEEKKNSFVAEHLGVVKKACRVWSTKSRRYILAAKEETNKVARNASV